MRTPLSLLAAALLLPACASRTQVATDSAAPVAAPATSTAAPAMTATAPLAPAVLGSSRAGRPIEAATFGRGPRRVYLIASIHGDESEGISAYDRLKHELTSIGNTATVRLVRDMNPDGSAARTRSSSSGVDLNRNWPASNFKSARANGPRPLSEPEAAAIHADITAFDPHVIIVLHSARSGPFVNYDGPAASAALAGAFASAARRAGDTRWRTVPDMGYPTPGSMGSYFGKDRQLPILTVEFRRGDPHDKIPAPLVAGVSAVLSDRTVALAPLSATPPSTRIATDTTPRPVRPVQPAR